MTFESLVGNRFTEVLGNVLVPSVYREMEQTVGILLSNQTSGF